MQHQGAATDAAGLGFNQVEYKLNRDGRINGTPTRSQNLKPSLACVGIRSRDDVMSKGLRWRRAARCVAGMACFGPILRQPICLSLADREIKRERKRDRCADRSLPRKIKNHSASASRAILKLSIAAGTPQ
jgi:hypothetical protein